MSIVRTESYRSWILGVLLLAGVLGAATLLFASRGTLGGYEVATGRLVLDTAVAALAIIVAILAAVRFRVEGLVVDLLLASGFLAIAVGALGFAVIPDAAGYGVDEAEAWALIAAELVGGALIAAAPFFTMQVATRSAVLVAGFALVVIGIGVSASVAVQYAPDLGVGVDADEPRSAYLTAAYAALAVLAIAAAVGFGLRYRREGRDLDSWLTIALTLIVFSYLHDVLSPTLSREYLLQGDFLVLLAYGVLLVGVWRAISEAEFGRAVAEERARVAREIHDGLAQYLFALSTHIKMLEDGAPLDDALPRMKKAVAAAQQEAKFAVLALSSASGRAQFDSSLRRYVDVLTADGALDVDLDIDPGVRLAPDEQIEVFRIVQEGLANARRHAGARHADVVIAERDGRRMVLVRDDGAGFEDGASGNGQGLRNMRQRAEEIDGALRVLSTPGEGTSIEVVLRPAA